MSKPYKMKGHELPGPSQRAKAGSSPNKNAMEGMKAGASMGAALGTIVPGVGNVVGGIIGGAGGAIFGGIKARKQKKKAELARMEQSKKDEMLAAMLAKKEEEQGEQSETDSIGYSDSNV